MIEKQKSTIAKSEYPSTQITVMTTMHQAIANTLTKGQVNYIKGVVNRFNYMIAKYWILNGVSGYTLKFTNDLPKDIDETSQLVFEVEHLNYLLQNKK